MQPDPKKTGIRRVRSGRHNKRGHLSNTKMKRDQYYRGWCSGCKEFVRWVEPTGRAVDKILCPGCGRLIPCLKGTNVPLKGEMISNARTYVEGSKRGKG